MRTASARLLLLVAACVIAVVQVPGADLKSGIDAAVQKAYQSAQTGLPCRVKTRGKPKMLRWEEVDRCLNAAAGRVDWTGVARDLEGVRAAAGRVSDADFNGQVDASLSAHALSFAKVLELKDDEALLPLTNSVLKFLPADSLQNLPVFAKAGDQVGTFLGPYAYERSGGLASGNTYRLALFQYTDRNGNVQSATDKLLLDSFGVPWKDAAAQPGFRLTVDKLLPEKKR
jgi:hypothetical protein